MKLFNRVILPSLAMCLPIMAQAATVSELEARIDQLEKMLLQQIQSQKQQSKKIETVEFKMVKATKALVKVEVEREPYGLTVYGSLRPRLTYRDEGSQSSTDVTDALSRIGIKGSKKLGNGLTAFYRGEWDVDIEANGDFGDARLAYVGVEGDFGRVAIGKQWSPHYNLVGEQADIFNHRSSAFGYDAVGPYRTAEMITYQFKSGGFTLDSGFEFNGNPAISGNSGNDSRASGADHLDTGSVGLSYDFGDVYLGASVLEQEGDAGFERGIVGASGSWSVSSDVYLAFSYQDIDIENDGLLDLNQEAYDLVGSVALGEGYKVKAGYFSYDDDRADGSTHDGFNLTLERQMGDFRLFTEWLTRDFDYQPKRNTLSVGFRYDFELLL